MHVVPLQVYVHSVHSSGGVGKAKRLSATGVLLGGGEPHGVGTRNQTQVLRAVIALSC